MLTIFIYSTCFCSQPTSNYVAFLEHILLQTNWQTRIDWSPGNNRYSYINIPTRICSNNLHLMSCC